MKKKLFCAKEKVKKKMIKKNQNCDFFVQVKVKLKLNLKREKKERERKK